MIRIDKNFIYNDQFFYCDIIFLIWMPNHDHFPKNFNNLAYLLQDQFKLSQNSNYLADQFVETEIRDAVRCFLRYFCTENNNTQNSKFSGWKLQKLFLSDFQDFQTFRNYDIPSAKVLEAAREYIKQKIKQKLNDNYKLYENNQTRTFKKQRQVTAYFSMEIYNTIIQYIFDGNTKRRYLPQKQKPTVPSTQQLEVQNSQSLRMNNPEQEEDSFNFMNRQSENINSQHSLSESFDPQIFWIQEAKFYDEMCCELFRR